MIIDIKGNELSVNGKRSWKRAFENHHFGKSFARQAPTMIEFKKLLYPMPLLFSSGFFFGVGTILWIKG